MDTEYEAVYTETDWYDGPREGIADFGGKPHAYQCIFDDAKENWSDIFLLRLVDEETFQLALEDWQIWLRWDEAYRAGRVSVSSHPALLEDRERHEQLAPILTARLKIQPVGALQAKADFKYIDKKASVRWTVIKQADPDEWLRLLYSIGSPANVSLSDEATRRESFYQDHG